MRIELRGVTKRFGEVFALRDLTLDVPSGAQVALVGPNGSGKSTLLRVLMGLMRAEGRIRLDGLDPLADRALLAPRIAYVPQISPQLAAPVREVVRAIADVRGIDASAFQEAASRLDLDLEGLQDRSFRGLSGGTRHKLLLSIALASPVSLLVLDEPTASLDADTRERFLHACADTMAKATLLLCSHRIEEMRHLVTHVVALREGTLAYDGPAADYLEQKALSMLQVCVASDEQGSWLAGRGFSHGADGWWARTVTHQEKVSLLPELATYFGSGLRDVQIHEVERVDAGDVGARHQAGPHA